MKPYIDNKLESVMDRIEEDLENAALEIADKFEPVELPESYCGNCYTDLIYDLRSRKIRYLTKTESENFTSLFGDETRLRLGDAISSHLLLYRLLSLYQCNVNSEGRNGYKVTWQIALRHKKSGKIIVFREWKGTPSLGYAENKFGTDIRSDLFKLIELLISVACPHPYDGTISGTQA